MARKSNTKDYATLFLARGILEDDVKMVQAALKAGGSLYGSWIDGKTSLLDLPSELGAKKIAAFLADLLDPARNRSLPMYEPGSGDAEQKQYWSPEFVMFVARRGYEFVGKTILKDGYRGTDLPPFQSVRSALTKIKSNWRRIKRVSTYDASGKDSGTSLWRLVFGADWKGDARIAGFELEFRVGAEGWDLFELYRDGDFTTRHGQPDPSDPMLDRQKVWEGLRIIDRLTDKTFNLEDLASAIRKGGNPFWRWEGKMLGEFSEPPEIRAFLARIRELCEPEAGFHRRLAPYITKEAMRGLVSAAILEATIPGAASGKKTLAEGRADTLRMALATAPLDMRH